MSKETITGGQYTSITIMFMISSSLFMGGAGLSGNSIWVSLLLAITMAVPLVCIYARLHALFPGKNIFDMLIAVFGKVAGRVVACSYIWYSLHLGALVLRNFGEFSKTVPLTATPMIVPMLCIGLLCVWAVRAGIEVIGRSAKFLVLFVLFELFIIQIFSLPLFEYHHLLPLLDNGWNAVLSDAMSSFSFPLAETVLLLGAFHSLPDRASAYRVMLSGVLISGGVIILVYLRNMLVLGPEIITSLYFPSYVATSRINIGDFLTRIEGSSAIAFVTALVIKVSLCLYVASIGIAKVFNLKSYRSVVLQMGLIMVYLSVFIFKDIMGMQYFAFHIYKVYAFPFQVIIPMILWIGSEIVVRRNKNKTAVA
ncbi:spore gernimation protein [Paenibacillus anaericanus]|uniref:Spore gernimation protein n=1 Tax=Paenibacillus anaericanus TaxID=170367 RepID=A0A3S1BJA7_9BACL|nr:endospore germination permease [Paenibacillus anaericanus]RUT42864.1 spore gernimation protein [Paenibacillus anaericanus]